MKTSIREFPIEAIIPPRPIHYVPVKLRITCLYAAPRFIGNKTVNATKGSINPQPGRTFALAGSPTRRKWF
jgi:hypothetical protein